MSDDPSCFNAPVEMLEAYKIKILDDIRNGRVYFNSQGEAVVEVPHELLIWLINQAITWQNLEHDSRAHQGGRP